jgi:aminopeptidase N
MKKILIAIALSPLLASGQQEKLSPKALFGSNHTYRNFWDVQRYELDLTPDFGSKSLKGTQKISFKVIKDQAKPILQIDLNQNFKSEITASFNIKNIRKEGDFIFVESADDFAKAAQHHIQIAYQGQPKQAKKAPWDGGWVFKSDEKGRPFMAPACQDDGASIWMPVKDDWSDEPDLGCQMTIHVPKDLVAVGNGRLLKSTEDQTQKHYVWEVKSPINSYNIVPYIGHYANYTETFEGENGPLDLSYWVLDYNLPKAKKQFAQTKPMLKAFEHWFGPYPFYQDGYKVVESPYLGMEHQSNIAYGNGFENGYLGQDLSGTGHGMLFDFILIHESGHEWFGNNITAKDIADMWIHEAFTQYSEVLYLDYTYGKSPATEYCLGLRNSMRLDKPIQGKMGLHDHASSDMYTKGANMVHHLRRWINDDEAFRQILRGLQKDFRHKNLSAADVEQAFAKVIKQDLSGFFEQYLRHTEIPTLEYRWKNKQFEYRWTDAVPQFKIAIDIAPNNTIWPNQQWQSINIDKNKLNLDPQYLIRYKQQ